MMNHRSPKMVEWWFNASGKAIDYRLKENVSKGQELLISYGAKDNAKCPDPAVVWGCQAPNLESYLASALEENDVDA